MALLQPFLFPFAPLGSPPSFLPMTSQCCGTPGDLHRPFLNPPPAHCSLFPILIPTSPTPEPQSQTVLLLWPTFCAELLSFPHKRGEMSIALSITCNIRSKNTQSALLCCFYFIKLYLHLGKRKPIMSINGWSFFCVFLTWKPVTELIPPPCIHWLLNVEPALFKIQFKMHSLAGRQAAPFTAKKGCCLPTSTPSQRKLTFRSIVSLEGHLPCTCLFTSFVYSMFLWTPPSQFFHLILISSEFKTDKLSVCSCFLITAPQFLFGLWIVRRKKCPDCNPVGIDWGVEEDCAYVFPRSNFSERMWFESSFILEVMGNIYPLEWGSNLSVWDQESRDDDFLGILLSSCIFYIVQYITCPIEIVVCWRCEG